MEENKYAQELDFGQSLDKHQSQKQYIESGGLISQELKKRKSNEIPIESP